MTDLAGQAVVITGGGRGMGAAYARAAAALGAKVVVNDIDADVAQEVVAQIRDAGGIAVAAVEDLRDPAAAERVVAHCIAEFGSITGLVNNAAICTQSLFVEETLERLRALIEVNVIGLFNISRAAIGSMRAQGFGSIVNIVSGAQTGQNGLSSYGATKGAVASFTYAWSSELEGSGVRVNAISPMAQTRMSGGLASLPLPEANVPPVMFLLSDRAEGLTGQVVRIMGNKLSIMAHPANRAPVLESDNWSLDSVGDAFDTTLRALALPSNVATYEISAVFDRLPQPVQVADPVH